MEHLPQKVWTDIPNIGDLDGIGRDELRALVESLNKSRMDLEARRFVESSLAKFASVVRFNANDNLKTWATRVLDEIVATADGLQACLYITDSENPNVLALAASHAFDSDRLDAQVPMGAGLLGQAAKSQKVYHFTEEADIATRTQTGLSVIRPRSVLIQPLVFGETVEGVLEINSLRVFGNEKLELIRLLAENIAANLMSIKNQEKMRHLFYEAQQRTEELMAQEEEMRQNMEELEATQEEMRRVQIELNGQISALNNAAIVSEADLKGDIIYANEQFCTVSKYSKEELLGRNHRILKSGTQPQELFEDLWATISAGKVWRGTICNRAKDGSLYWVQSVITPVIGVDGKPKKYIGVRYEITKIKEQEELIRQALEEAQAQEEELRQNAEELEAVNEEMRRAQIELNFITDCVGKISYILRFSPDGIIRDANERFFIDTGYPREYLVDKSYSTLFVDDSIDGEPFESFWNKILSEKISQGKFERKKMDGASFWVLANYFVRKDAQGNVYEVVKFAQDVTEIVKLQQENAQKAHDAETLNEELRQNLEELEAAQEEMRRIQIELAGQVNALNNGAIVSEADLKGDIIYVNDEFCRIAKYDASELLGQNHRILKSGTQPQELFEDLWATIGAGKVWRGTICNRAKDGSFYWVQSVITPVLGADKKPVKYIGVRFEITQLKKQEEQIRQAFEEAQAQEEELRQNLEELEAAQEEMRRIQIELAGQVNALNNGAIVSEADLKGDIIYVNDEFCRIAKYDKSELLGQNHRILKSGTQPQELFEDLWATIGAGKVWRGTICNRAKDGSFYWVQSVITPVLGADKKPVKYIGVRFEITQLKKQEEQIRLALENAKSQEETFRRRLDELKANDSRRFIMERVLENLDVGVLITDAGGKPVFANATASEILGRGVRPDATLDDLACVYELYSETDACPYPAERLPLSLALSGNASRANDVVVRRENDALPISISGIPITDETGAVAYAVAIVSPRESRPSPTDLGKSVLSSDFANQCLQGVINASNETFFAIDREYRVILANETIKKKYKDAGKDEIAPGTSVWELLPAEDHDYHRTHFSRALSGESFVLPVRYADAKGGELDFDVNYYPLKDENGNVFGAAIHARTAHERKTDERRYRSAVALIEAAFAAPQKAAMLLDSNFNVEYATESARALLHAKSKEQDGAVFGLEKIVSNPEDWGELATTLKKFGYVETSVGTPAGVARIRLVPAQTGYLAVFEF